MDVKELIRRIEASRSYRGQIEHIEEIPARIGRFASPLTPLDARISRLLASKGIEQLYTHQVAGLEAGRDGRHFVIVTGTASGKTLAYNLPVLETCLADPNARALYFYPTKALAQDQLKGLIELTTGDEAVAARIRPGVYDGDTPTAQRKRIRSEANLVLSNPDMLHASILPYHSKWSSFFSELKYVVIDEVHMYRGILGAHVAAVLRRLDRVCEHYGSSPTYIAASATIANPGELASRLTGREMQVIDDDGAPRGRKFFVFWNPTPIGHDSLARKSASDDAVDWLVEAMEYGAQCLAFTRTRQAAELIQRYAREKLEQQHSPLASHVRAYRGGYLPDERRSIERDMFTGKLRGVASTNALELGIDVGSLDVALLVNYPGSIASAWQQAGRSGRRQGDSLAVLLAGNDPVDQYLLRHPEYFFAQSPEHAVVDPENPFVLARHLKAAAFELPLEDRDYDRFGAMAPPIVELLADEQQLVKVGDQFFCPGGQNPAVGISLRHMSDNTFSIVLQSKATSRKDIFASGAPTVDSTEHSVIANVDSISAPELIHPEAIYLHDGKTYLVRELDLNGKIAYVDRRETDYYTQAVLEHNVLITGGRASSSAIDGATVGYGDVDVSWQTVAFKKIKFTTRENIGLGPVDIPAQNLVTTGVWLAPDDATRVAMNQQGHRASEGVVGLRNLAVVALPIIAMCDRRDLGGVVDSKNLSRSTLILYDRYPGGLGYCEKGFSKITSLIALCYEIVADCPCPDGCPSCVGLPELNPGIHTDPDLMRGQPLPNKRATVGLLELLTQRAMATSL